MRLQFRLRAQSGGTPAQPASGLQVPAQGEAGGQAASPGAVGMGVEGSGCQGCPPYPGAGPGLGKLRVTEPWHLSPVWGSHHSTPLPPGLPGLCSRPAGGMEGVGSGSSPASDFLSLVQRLVDA